jgi:hypothetical protein
LPGGSEENYELHHSGRKERIEERESEEGKNE